MVEVYADSRAVLQQEIDRWERRDLEGLTPPAVDLDDLLDGQNFVGIRGISVHRGEHNLEEALERTTDFVISAHSYESYLSLVFAGTGAQVRVYCSICDPATTSNLLRAANPGVMLDVAPHAHLGTTLRQHFAYAGLLSGIPSDASRSDPDNRAVSTFQTYMDRVIRGMRDARWVVVIRSYPRLGSDSTAARDEVLERIAIAASLSKQHVQRSSQSSSALTNRTTDVTSDTLSADIINRRADYAVELMEIENKRLTRAIATGRWQVAVYFGSAVEADARRLGALLRGTLSGSDSRPDPIRVHFCSRTSSRLDSRFDTYLNSEELALLLRLPSREAPGYAVSDLPNFDVDVSPCSGHSVAIGEVVWDGWPAGGEYKLAVNNFTRHALIVGVTGSGKTTTVMNLITQMWHEAGVPFLVVEPAKTEYRTLLGQYRNGKADGPVPDLRLFTLGDETVAPFRLNPFEFDCGKTPGGPQLLSHIDLLKTIFNAAFILYAPMPYVLETALYEVYEDKGWNLATGVNVRLPQEVWQDRDQFPIFPTISDLYNKIEPVTIRLGYDSRIAQDVIAGLKARVGSLRLGSKGLMLDTPRGVPISDLLSYPTVLELESIGNDEEKTFLMGLIFARLYSFRRMQALEGMTGEDLRHLLVIEEAHRLLKNTSTQVDTEAVNLRAHAIETFVNMLSEVRHYGQGVLVAEQIPAKLTPDVIKNTNFKLVHRLLARDDRDLLAGTMTMDENQSRHLSVLRAGEAVAYAEGDDAPYLLKISNFKGRERLSPPEQEALSKTAGKYIELRRYLCFPEIHTLGIKTSHFGGPDPVVIQAILLRLGREDMRRVWATILARTLFARQSLVITLQKARYEIQSDPGHLIATQFDEAMALWIIFGAVQAVEDRRAERAWPYPLAAKLYKLLAAGLVKLARTNDITGVSLELDRFARAYEAELTKDRGPYPGCLACPSPCVYQPEVKRLMERKDVANVRGILTGTAYKDQAERYRELASMLEGMGRQWLGSESAEARNLGYCTGLLAGTTLGLDDFEQAKFASELAPYLVL